MSVLLFSYSVDGRNIASDPACGRDQVHTDAQLVKLELPPLPPDFNVDWQYFFHPRSTLHTITSTLKLGVARGGMTSVTMYASHHLMWDWQNVDSALRLDRCRK